jgi:hypothetical protein
MGAQPDEALADTATLFDLIELRPATEEHR